MKKITITFDDKGAPIMEHEGYKDNDEANRSLLCAATIIMLKRAGEIMYEIREVEANGLNQVKQN